MNRTSSDNNIQIQVKHFFCKLNSISFEYKTLLISNMWTLSTKEFREILKNDGFSYTIVSKGSEQIEIDFPNLPDWHKEEWDSRRDEMPKTVVICFEYNGLNYKIRSNKGDADCNDGNFGAVYDANGDKIMELMSTGDTETTFQLLKPDGTKVNDDLLAKLEPYLKYLVVLHNNSQLEYVVFKILAENDCLIDDEYFD